MDDTDLKTQYLYYDKDLANINKLVLALSNQMKTINERNELGDVITISKSVFDRINRDKYAINHPNYLYHLQIGDVTATAIKDGERYGVNLIGSKNCPLGFQSVNGDVEFLTSIKRVSFDELDDLFTECIRHLVYKEYVPLELF